MIPKEDGTTVTESLQKRLEKLLTVIGNCLHKHQTQKETKAKNTTKDAEEDEPNGVAKEKAKRMRENIMELVEECKRVTVALAEQVVEGKATIEVIQQNIGRVKDKWL